MIKNTGTLTLTPKERWSILQRDNFTCQYCGARAPEARLHVDHVRARARGGTNDERNLITACELCNAGKRDAPMLEYWWMGHHYAVAGQAMEDIIPIFGRYEKTSMVLWELLQVILGSDNPTHVLEHLQGIQTWESLEAALLVLAPHNEDDSDIQDGASIQ